MDGKTFIERLQKEFGGISLGELAKILGKKTQQLSNMKKLESVSALTVARMMAQLNKQVVRGRDLLPAVKRKLSIDSRKDLEATLSITLSNWENQSRGLSPNQIANAISASRAAAKAESHKSLIRPIVEFFPLDVVESSQGAHYELFATKASKGASRQQEELRNELTQRKGIYIFYDSRGKAIYAGKAQQQNLWGELKSVFNRTRESQSVYRIEHPKRNQKFKLAFEEGKQPKKMSMLLSDIAAYVSVYEVDTPMIGSLEALLVRGFANDLLNVRMERFSSVNKPTPKKRKAKAKVISTKASPTRKTPQKGHKNTKAKGTQ